MAMGLQAAYGADALQQNLRQRLMDQIAAEQRTRANTQQQFENDLNTKKFDSGEELKRAQLAALVESRAGAEADRQSAGDLKLADTVPAGTTLAPTSPIAGRLQRIGLAQPNMTLPSAQTGGGVALPADPNAAPADAAMPITGTLRTMQSPEQIRDFTKLPSEKQNQDAEKTANDLRINERITNQNDAQNELKRSLMEIQQKVQQGQLNNQEAMLAIRERLASVAEQGAEAKANKGITVSQGGKAAIRAIEGAAPLTDQAMKLMESEFPGIDTNPEKYNTLADKAGSLYKAGKYYAGFSDPNDPRQQIVSLLKPIQAGQYTQSSRSYRMVELALEHMASMTQTPARQYEAMKNLRDLMPELRSGVIRAESPVDPNKPLAGSYLDPEKAPAGAAPATKTPSKIKSITEIK